MHEIAVDCFLKKGYSCSESVVMAAAEKGLVPVELVNVGTGFSGGMGDKCLCGAISGAQIVISYLHGKNKTNRARILAKKFIDEFKDIHKVTCCKALTAKFDDFHSPERKQHCVNMVESSSKILTEILKEASEPVA